MTQSPTFISTFVCTSVRLASLSLTLRPADEFNSLGSFHSHFFFVSLYERTKHMQSPVGLFISSVWGVIRGTLWSHGSCGGLHSPSTRRCLQSQHMIPSVCCHYIKLLPGLFDLRNRADIIFWTIGNLCCCCCPV